MSTKFFEKVKIFCFTLIFLINFPIRADNPRRNRKGKPELLETNKTAIEKIELAPFFVLKISFYFNYFVFLYSNVNRPPLHGELRKNFGFWYGSFGRLFGSASLNSKRWGNSIVSIIRAAKAEEIVVIKMNFPA